MKIVVATAHGMCFGVSDALAAADRIENPSEVTIYGELVHNELVRERLLARGFAQMGERDREIPSTPAVLITAHGVSGAERGRLAAAQLRVVDTTCPLVRHAHSMALQLDAEDRLVVVVGKADHVEVRGIVGDLRRFVVIESAVNVGNLGAERIGVMSQTTTPDARFAEVVAAIRRENPNVTSRSCRRSAAPRANANNRWRPSSKRCSCSWSWAASARATRASSSRRRCARGSRPISCRAPPRSTRAGSRGGDRWCHGRHLHAPGNSRGSPRRATPTIAGGGSLARGLGTRRSRDFAGGGPTSPPAPDAATAPADGARRRRPRVFKKKRPVSWLNPKISP